MSAKNDIFLSPCRYEYLRAFCETRVEKRKNKISFILVSAPKLFVYFVFSTFPLMRWAQDESKCRTFGQIRQICRVSIYSYFGRFWQILRRGQISSSRLRLYWYGVDQLRADPSILVSSSLSKHQMILSIHPNTVNTQSILLSRLSDNAPIWSQCLSLIHCLL